MRRRILVGPGGPKGRGGDKLRRLIRNPATLASNATEAVTHIMWQGRTFRLRERINLSVRRRGPYCFIEYEPLGISGYGRDEQEALEAFAADFATTWDWIAEARDSQLASDARELKRGLQALVAALEVA